MWNVVLVLMNVCSENEKLIMIWNKLTISNVLLIKSKNNFKLLNQSKLKFIVRFRLQWFKTFLMHINIYTECLRFILEYGSCSWEMLRCRTVTWVISLN